MAFNLLVLMMLGLLKKTLALELHNFCSKLNKKFQEVSQSAFIQNRYKLKPELFYQISSLVATDYFNKIITRERRISLELALMLENILGVTATIILAIQTKNELMGLDKRDKKAYLKYTINELIKK